MMKRMRKMRRQKNKVDLVIAKFKTRKNMAEKTGFKYKTISSWVLRGRIPAPYQQAILDTGKDYGVTADDLVNEVQEDV